jgi:hypothetical protein
LNVKKITGKKPPRATLLSDLIETLRHDDQAARNRRRQGGLVAG